MSFGQNPASSNQRVFLSYFSFLSFFVNCRTDPQSRFEIGVDGIFGRTTITKILEANEES